jgi:hypothetical protein
MKKIIECSGTKNGEPWAVSGLNGIQIKFVSHPNACKVTPGIKLFRPDDMVPDSSMTWREYLNDYNKHMENPDHLLRAGHLYQDKTYHILVDRFGWENTYILSAGWGLVRSDYYLPLYDITFSKNAADCYKRKRTDKYKDFNHLLIKDKNIDNDQIYVFAGIDYLPLLYELTEHTKIKKYVFHKSDYIKRVDNYKYIKYHTNQSTNWHYSCAQDFANGKINP